MDDHAYIDVLPPSFSLLSAASDPDTIISNLDLGESDHDEANKAKAAYIEYRDDKNVKFILRKDWLVEMVKKAAEKDLKKKEREKQKRQAAWGGLSKAGRRRAWKKGGGGVRKRACGRFAK